MRSIRGMPINAKDINHLTLAEKEEENNEES
jgi:hypothetical protein